MKYFKKGQTVYHYKYGEGIVEDDSWDSVFPIKVDFAKNACTFTYDGRYDKNEPITLSQKPICEIVNIPLKEELKVGDYVKTSIGKVGRIYSHNTDTGNSFYVIVRCYDSVSKIICWTERLVKITEEEYYEKFFQKNDVVLYKDSDEDEDSWKIGYFKKYEYLNEKHRFLISSYQDKNGYLTWNQCKLYKP